MTETKKCYHPFVKRFTKDSCKNADVKDGIVVCMIRERQKGWRCDYENEKPTKIPPITKKA